MGSIAINNISKAYRLGNIGYWVRQSAQGQGAVPEALQEVVPFGFGTLGLTRLEIIAAENHVSHQIAERPHYPP